MRQKLAKVAIADAFRAGPRPMPGGLARARPAPPALELIRSEPPTDSTVSGLVHRYPGGIEAVRGVDLAVPAGASIAIVGQNGSGKTTLVKHLNGLLRPDQGSVAIGGRDIAGEAVSRLARTGGVVFQNPDDQLFHRSVEREVAFGPRNLGLDARTTQALVDRALDLVGLDGLRSVNPYDLDVSLRKLVALASVVALEPAVLVLDEPTTGQDGPGQERVGAIVDAFVAAGRSFVAITHDMEFAAAHFERIVVMRAGQIATDGPPSQCLDRSTWDVLRSTGLIPPIAARLEVVPTNLSISQWSEGGLPLPGR